MVEVSFRNFLAECLLHLPLPALLRFDADRQQRAGLQDQITQLQVPPSCLRMHPCSSLLPWPANATGQ